MYPRLRDSCVYCMHLCALCVCTVCSVFRFQIVVLFNRCAVKQRPPTTVRAHASLRKLIYRKCIISAKNKYGIESRMRFVRHGQWWLSQSFGGDGGCFAVRSIMNKMITIRVHSTHYKRTHSCWCRFCGIVWAGCSLFVNVRHTMQVHLALPIEVEDR